MTRKKRMDLFDFLAYVDRLEEAAWSVATKTIRHPKMPDALIRLNKALGELSKAKRKVANQ